MQQYFKKYKWECARNMETIKHYKIAISQFYVLCHQFFNAGSLHEHERLFMEIMEVLDMCYRYKREMLENFIDEDENPFVEDKL